MKVINYQLALDYLSEVNDAVLRMEKATPLTIRATSEMMAICKKTVYDLLRRLDTIDVECAIRCSWCKHCHSGVCDILNMDVEDHFYCAYGEQKDVRGTINLQYKEDQQ